MQKTFGGHKTAYYFRLILQNVLGIKRQPRKPSLWNAFVSLELKKLNTGMWLMDIGSIPVPTIVPSFTDPDATADGPNRVNSIAIKDLSTRWKAMTPEEQTAVAGEELKKLIERQKNKTHGVQNVKQNACNDVRATLASVTRQVRPQPSFVTYTELTWREVSWKSCTGEPSTSSSCSLFGPV